MVFTKVFFCFLVSAAFGILIPIEVKAQETNHINDDSLFSRNHIGINTCATQSHIEVQQQSGSDKPSSHSTFGYEAGADITINLNKTIGVKIGFDAGNQIYQYIINQDDRSQILHQTYILYTQVPLELIINGRLGKKLFVYGGGGIAHRFYLFFNDVGGGPDGFVYNGSATSNNFKQYKELITSGPPFLIIPRLDFGCFLQLHNLNFLKFAFHIDLGNSITYSANYNYIDFHGKDIGSGTYNAAAPYIGFNVGYVFTRAPKH